MAGILENAPADLTRLAANNDGVFPTRRVVSQIDGRTPLSGHGGEMPVYGWFFKGSPVTLYAETGTEIPTTRAVADLIAWLKAIQD